MAAIYDAEVSRYLIRYGMGLSPHVITRARGSRIWDQEGREFLDFTSGQMCATIGHNHPKIVEAMQRACEGVLHLYSGFVGSAVVSLAERLAKLLPAPLTKSLFLSTGAESNDAAMRMARLYTGRYEIVGFAGGWHGVTGGTASLTFAGEHHLEYGPRMPGSISIAPPNCYRCPVRQCRDTCNTVCLDVGFDVVDAQSSHSLAAFIAEPVLSVGGIIVPPEGYMPKLKAKCDERGMLLILDEAQTAFGRMGSNFAFERMGVVPDIVTVSKTLGGGLPLSATITSAEIEQRCFERGFVHATSHVSDPLPAEVGLAVLDVLEAERLNERATRLGERLKRGLLNLQQRYDIIGDVRGYGLLLGVELVKDGTTREPDSQRGGAIAARCMELGLSMNIVNFEGLSAVWRIAPPLTVTEAEIDRALAILDRAINDIVGGST